MKPDEIEELKELIAFLKEHEIAEFERNLESSLIEIIISVQQAKAHSSHSSRGTGDR